MNRFLSFLVGAIIGALAGAAIAILFAPASGDELRLQIRDKATYYQDEVKRAAADRRAELEQQLSALRAPKQPGPTP